MVLAIGSFLVGIFPYGTETVKDRVFFVYESRQIQNLQLKGVPCNKLLTSNLACSRRTGEYWASSVFVQTSLRSVRIATTSGQYSQVRPYHSVSKILLLQYQPIRKSRVVKSD